MTADKKINFEDWIFEEPIAEAERIAEVFILLDYPGIDCYQGIPIQERAKKTDAVLQQKLLQLLSLNLIGDYELNGGQERPRGISCRLSLAAIRQISKEDYVSEITLKKVTGARELKKRKRSSTFFCLKLVVVIDIEGVDTKMQTIEERFVLIKAKSIEEARSNVENEYQGYAEPYLNSDGRLVRFRLERIADVYQTDMDNFTDLNKGRGVEVFSKFRTRKRPEGDVWDGAYRQPE